MIFVIGVNEQNEKAVKELGRALSSAVIAATPDLSIGLTGLAVTIAYFLDSRPLPEEIKTFAVAAMIKIIADDAEVSVDHVMRLLQDMANAGDGDGGSVPGPTKN